MRLAELDQQVGMLRQKAVALTKGEIFEDKKINPAEIETLRDALQSLLAGTIEINGEYAVTTILAVANSIIVLQSLLDVLGKSRSSEPLQLKPPRVREE